jgi:CHASE2 domain-containing sensor protein
MMDAVRGNYGFTTRETSPHRETLRADLVAKARETAPTGTLTEIEKQQALSFYNSTLHDLDQIRDPKYVQDLAVCFPRLPEEQELYAALLIKRSDNDTAREVKGEYRQLLNSIKRDASLARRLFSKLGPGTHHLSNGDVVHISRDKRGNISVRTEHPDGSSKEVSYNLRTPGDARVQTTSADGHTTVTQRRGQTVTRKEDRVETTYSLDRQGRPVREARGPGHDDYTRTTVNRDGSTDTRELLYYSDEVEEGEDPAVYEDTHQPPRGREYHDAGAGRAIEKLKASNPETITADMLRKLVVSATADLDNQAAGKEYQDLKNFVTQNWDKLDEDAKQAWQVYERYVYDAKAKGQTGINIKDFEAMKKEMAEIGKGGEKPQKYHDAGAGEAIEKLKASNPKVITADMLRELVVSATADLDNQAAGKEYQDLKDFVTQNWDKLDKDAKQAWQVYERYVYDAKAKGQTGINIQDFEAMKDEMAEIAGKVEKPQKYHDAGAGEAIEKLKASNPKVITADMIRELVVSATADFDNQAAGKEYQDLKDFVTQNWDKLDKDAKQAWQVYERYVYDAKAKGQTGIYAKDFEAMKDEMAEIGGGGEKPRKYRDAGAGKAIEDFRRNEPDKITPDMLRNLIVAATIDPDNQSAGKEYQDLKDYVGQVEDKLTPEAKRMWEIYESFVQRARDRGQTGMTPEQYLRMMGELFG